ncbi:MAG: ABC transporter ATP-binding protein [Myxococcota bacterium]
MSPRARVIAYVRQLRGRYVFGALLTVLYAVFFQLVPLSVRAIVARIDAELPLADVSRAVAGFVIVAMGLAVFRFASRNVLFRAARRIEYRLRNDLLAHLQKLPQSYFSSHRTGDLMSRAVNDVNNVRLLLGMGLLNLVQTPVLYIGAIGVMLATDWPLALWVMLPYPLFVGIARFFGRRLHASNLAIQEQLGALSTTVQENASGVLVVRAYGLEPRERERFECDNASLYRRQVRLARVTAGLRGTIALLPTLAQLLWLMAGATRVRDGAVSHADLWLFFVYTFQLTFPTFIMGWVINVAQRAQVGLERLGEILDTEPSIRDHPRPARMDRIVGEIAIRGLTVRYPGRADVPALCDVSLRAEAGGTLAIVGPVGAGKSTLLRVIPRLIEVPEGAISIDGVELHRVPLALLRESIAMVPQDSFLFSTTIAENIRFGAPDAELSEVREAARQAHILEEIEALPRGFDTPVGERGITLSGGQRQRLALARALLRRPSILILDDALSSVDAATEEGILKELRAARRGCTSLIVAHRLSSLRDADRIVVLDAGRVVEMGSHEALLRREGAYARIHRQQQLEAELEEESA